MIVRKAYDVLDKDQKFAGGQRVPANRVVHLTEGEAKIDLRNGNIRLKPDADAEAPPAEPVKARR